MSKKVKLADVLWKAANEHLWDGKSPASSTESRWSCNSTIFVTGSSSLTALKPHPEVGGFLKSLGCQLGKENYTFGQRTDERRQGVRYIWLLLAMHVAEDENIWIEVDS